MLAHFLGTFCFVLQICWVMSPSQVILYYSIFTNNISHYNRKKPEWCGFLWQQPTVAVLICISGVTTKGITDVMTKSTLCLEFQVVCVCVCVCTRTMQKRCLCCMLQDTTSHDWLHWLDIAAYLLAIMDTLLLLSSDQILCFVQHSLYHWCITDVQFYQSGFSNLLNFIC